MTLVGQISETPEYIRINRQKWDCNVSKKVVSIPIWKLNHKRFLTKWAKVQQYATMYTATETYPPIVVEDLDSDGFANIVDGAHRVKALMQMGVENVNAVVVINHNN